MKPFRRGWSRLLGVIEKRRHEKELAAEIASHIEMQIEDNLRAGMSPTEAEHSARLKFGGLESVKSGVAAGLGASWAVARLLEDFLFAVKPRDPVAFVAVPVVLSVVALLAVWFPATRASRVDPVVALRYE